MLSRLFGITSLNSRIRMRWTVLALLPKSVSAKIEVARPLNVPPSLPNLNLSKELRICQRSENAATFDHRLKIDENLLASGVLQQELLIWPNRNAVNRWKHVPNQVAQLDSVDRRAACDSSCPSILLGAKPPIPKPSSAPAQRRALSEL